MNTGTWHQWEVYLPIAFPAIIIATTAIAKGWPDPPGLAIVYGEYMSGKCTVLTKKATDTGIVNGKVGFNIISIGR